MSTTTRKKLCEVRSWPYPFQAGVAISNDAEYMSFDFFEELMAFLNTENQTILGQGLGIEFTSSMFHFSANPYNFSVFAGAAPDAKCTKCAHRIDEYLREGWIDTLHAYGDFDHAGGFERAHAVRCLEHLKKIGVSINVFSNHGGVENIQNVGRDASYHRGDHKGHLAYHTDLWKEMGIRYAWTDSMVTHSLKPSPQTIRQRLGSLRRSFMRDTAGGYFKAHDSGVLKIIRLNDDLNVEGFLRFRGTGVNAPNLSSLGYQLDQIPWQEFYQNGEGIVLYQHFGVLYRVNGRCVAATIQAIKQRPEVYLAPFRFLAKEFAEGRLWVAGCARFLNYLKMRDEIRVTCGQDGFVRLQLNATTSNPREMLQGLTIYIDPANFRGLIFEGAEVPFQFNGPDSTDRYSVTVPVQKLSNIWN
jgi:hypothetical protein